MTFRKAAGELRAHLGYSRQKMADSLGISVSVVYDYEATELRKFNPDARPVCAYMMVADASSRPDLAQVFHQELREALALPDAWELIIRRLDSEQLRTAPW